VSPTSPPWFVRCFSGLYALGYQGKVSASDLLIPYEIVARLCFLFWLACRSSSVVPVFGTFARCRIRQVRQSLAGFETQSSGRVQSAPEATRQEHQCVSRVVVWSSVS